MQNAVHERVRMLATMLLTAAFVVSGHPLMAQVKVAPVNGIWAEDSTTDIGKTFGNKTFEGFKIRGWVSTYYNHRTSNGSQGQLIGGRVYDIRDQSFAVEQAKIEMEKVPELGSGGFKLDLGYGDGPDQTFQRVANAQGANADSPTGRTMMHATVGYLADIGSGLRIDVGKMQTHIGNEYADSIKNLNFSHDFIYTFGIPYNQTGVRLNYKVNEHFTGELYVLNGWNTHYAINKGKAVAPSVQWAFGPLSGAVNYFGGQETDAGTGQPPIPGVGPGAQPNSTFAAGTRSTLRQLFDTQVLFMQGPWTLQGAAVYGTQKGVMTQSPVAGAVPPSAADTRTVKWWGTAVYAAFKINERHQPALRWEQYMDPNNYTTQQATTITVPGGAGSPWNSVATRFNSLTLTWNYKPAAHLLLRPEVRVDHANRRTSLQLDNHGRPVATNATIGANAIFYF